MTRIGVVGIGNWGSKVLEEYVGLRDDGKLNKVVACDTDEERLADAGRADARYTELSAALSQIDGLHMCTPVQTHAPLGRQVLNAGVDLLAEKPFTSDRDTAFELMQIAFREDLIIQTGHIYRFANVIEKLRELYQEGKFGEVHTVTVRWTHRLIDPPRTNVLWDLAPHPIDILNYITGDWPSDEYSRCRTRSGVDGPTSATVQFRLAGADVTMQISWDDEVRRRNVEIAGPEASALVETVEQNIKLYENKNTTSIPVTKNNTIQDEAAHFIEAIKTRRNSANSAVVGVRTVEAIERIEEARDSE